MNGVLFISSAALSGVVVGLVLRMLGQVINGRQG
jgi:hypothetical protein